MRLKQISFPIVLIVIFSVLVFVAYQRRDISSKYQTLKALYKKLLVSIQQERIMIGNEIFSKLELSSEGGSRFKINTEKNEYHIVIVIGKLNCASCIDQIREAMDDIDEKKVSISTIVYFNELRYVKDFYEKYYWKNTVYFGNTTEWYNKNNLIVGPSIFLVDSNSGKILNCYIDMSSDLSGSKSEYLNSLNRLFGQNGIK